MQEFRRVKVVPMSENNKNIFLFIRLMSKKSGKKPV